MCHQIHIFNFSVTGKASSETSYVGRHINIESSTGICFSGIGMRFKWGGCLWFINFNENYKFKKVTTQTNQLTHRVNYYARP